MVGGAGNDTYVVDNASDVVTEDSGTTNGVDLVQASISYTISDADVENLTLTGSADIDATGNASENILTGNTGDNILDGGSGADILDGGEGEDIMIGRTGDDTYVVDNTGDTITEAASAGTDTVQSSVTHTLAANVENLVLTGAGAINGTGNTLANTITGNAAANTLDGGAGADTLTGIALTDTTLGRGTIDVLTGGSENDLFVLGNASGVFYSDGSRSTSGRGDYARITDFSSGDKIQLKGRSSDYRLRNETFNGVAGVGLYLNDGSVVSGWDSRDELIGFIQVSGVTLNLGSTTQFTYVA
jgi:putative cofactor-binding repeat protein